MAGVGTAILVDKFGRFLINSWAQYRMGEIIGDMEKACIDAIQNNSCYAAIVCEGIEDGYLKSRYIDGDGGSRDLRDLIEEGSQLPHTFSSGSPIPTSGVDVAGGIVGGIIIDSVGSK